MRPDRTVTLFPLEFYVLSNHHAYSINMFYKDVFRVVITLSYLLFTND